MYNYIYLSIYLSIYLYTYTHLHSAVREMGDPLLHNKQQGMWREGVTIYKK